MLHWLLTPLASDITLFNVFRYITFRSGGAVLTALLISLLFGPRMIRWLKSLQAQGQPIRDDGPESHIVTKQGTPTMGGVMMLASVSVSVLLWGNLSNAYTWLILFVTLGFGAIGFADDYFKVTHHSSYAGLSARMKLLLQGGVALAAALWTQYLAQPEHASHLAFPFFKNVLLDLGVLYLAFAVLVMVGSSNAVNLTDGLDGLAIVPIMIVAASLGLIAYLVGHISFAAYLQLHPVPGAGELAVYCAALIGAGLGFLWFNAPPAMVFMGDTGSLSFGGAIGALAVITKHELVLVVLGGLFVLEAVSVIVQVASFKLTGKRVFRMAPLHHHFEKKGWAEPTVVIRFWIIATVLALIGLSTLKLQ